MNKLVVFLLTLSLLVGGASAAQAQRGYRRGRVLVAPPRAYGYRPPYYGPRYYHAAPYRTYGGRAYYGRPRYYRRPVYRRGPTVIIRH